MKFKKIFCVAVVAGALVAITMSQSAPSSDNIVELVNQQKTLFSLPPLPFSYDALEPYIDARTMELHYSRHEKTYVDGLNKLVPGTAWQNKTLPEMFREADKLPEAIRNNAGGHWNHTFFWSILASAKDNPGMSPKLEHALVQNFGSVDAFKQEFRKAGLTRFGSGWAWLIQTADGSLKITSSLNDDNPLMNTAVIQGTPLLTCDVWEHAYYLKRQNHRDDYLDAFFNVVNWKQVEAQLK